MKICLNTGSTATALGPTSRSSVGTSRQPSTSWPSSITISSNSVSNPLAHRRVAGKEHQAGPIATLGRQGDPDPAGFFSKEPVRHLHQDAGAVTGVRLAPAGTAVEQVDEQLQRLADDAVAFLALDVDDEADSAGVVLGAADRNRP